MATSLKLGVLALAGTALLASPPASIAAPEKPGAALAGSYVILLDGKGKVLAGRFKVSPNLFVQSSKFGFMLVDRPLLPRHWMNIDELYVARSSYKPAVRSGTWQAGKKYLFERSISTLGIVAGKDVFSKPQKDTAGIKILKVSVLRISGRADRYIDYRLLAKSEFPKPDRRVYFPDLQLDTTANIAAKTRVIRIGKAANTLDFLNLYMLAGPGAKQARLCLQKFRSTKRYDTAAKTYRKIVDGFNDRNFAKTGIPYQILHKTHPSGDILAKAQECALAFDGASLKKVLIKLDLRP